MVVRLLLGPKLNPLMMPSSFDGSSELVGRAGEISVLGESLLSAHASERDMGGAENTNPTSWVKIWAIIVTNMLGTGVLSLPKATAQLGWIPAAVVFFLCTLGAFYSGYMFARLFAAVPTARYYAVWS